MRTKEDKAPASLLALLALTVAAAVPLAMFAFGA
jgi:hypothetical protein